MASKYVELGGLNLDVDPHPYGVYSQTLNAGASLVVRARGSDFAKISSLVPVEGHEGIFHGRILIFTDIDMDQPWLDLQSETELQDEIKNKINIPENAKPHYRSFDFILNDSTHQLWFETRNLSKETLGPSTAKRIISSILRIVCEKNGSPEISVTIIPDEGAIDKILALPRLQVLTIRVNKPNADHSSAAARQRVSTKMQQQNAGSIELKLTKDKIAERLTITKDTEELALVGADTGFVRGEAKNVQGEKIVLSTEDLPRRRRVKIESSGGGFLAKFASFLPLRRS